MFICVPLVCLVPMGGTGVLGSSETGGVSIMRVLGTETVLWKRSQCSYCAAISSSTAPIQIFIF